MAPRAGESPAWPVPAPYSITVPESAAVAPVMLDRTANSAPSDTTKSPTPTAYRPVRPESAALRT